jgi:hypothetical protein
VKVNHGELEEAMPFLIGPCVRGHSLEVVIDCLEEEPSCVSSIEAGVIPAIVEVGDKPTMPEDSSKLNNGFLGFFEEPSGQEEALQ